MEDSGMMITISELGKRPLLRIKVLFSDDILMSDTFGEAVLEMTAQVAGFIGINCDQEWFVRTPSTDWKKVEESVDGSRESLIGLVAVGNRLKVCGPEAEALVEFSS
jgi:hypothetical protein